MLTDEAARFLPKLLAAPPVTKLIEIHGRQDLPRCRLYSPLFDPFVDLVAAKMTTGVGTWMLVLVADFPPCPITLSGAAMIELIEQVARAASQPHLVLDFENFGVSGNLVSVLFTVQQRHAEYTLALLAKRLRALSEHTNG